jgi:hypothetical protein
VSSRARFHCFEVGDEVAVEHVGEPSFETAHRFHRGLAGGSLAPVVVLTFTGVADLADRNDV